MKQTTRKAGKAVAFAIATMLLGGTVLATNDEIFNATRSFAATTCSYSSMSPYGASMLWSGGDSGKTYCPLSLNTGSQTTTIDYVTIHLSAGVEDCTLRVYQTETSGAIYQPNSDTTWGDGSHSLEWTTNRYYGGSWAIECDVPAWNFVYKYEVDQD